MPYKKEQMVPTHSSLARQLVFSDYTGVFSCKMENKDLALGVGGGVFL